MDTTLFYLEHSSTTKQSSCTREFKHHESPSTFKLDIGHHLQFCILWALGIYFGYKLIINTFDFFKDKESSNNNNSQLEKIDKNLRGLISETNTEISVMT